MIGVPAHGHMSPHLPVLAELVARGHRVEVTTPTGFAPAVAATGATVVWSPSAPPPPAAPPAPRAPTASQGLHETPVDGHPGPGDVARPPARQEDHQVGDLVGPAEPARCMTGGRPAGPPLCPSRSYFTVTFGSSAPSAPARPWSSAIDSGVAPPLPGSSTGFVALPLYSPAQALLEGVGGGRVRLVGDDLVDHSLYVQGHRWTSLSKSVARGSCIRWPDLPSRNKCSGAVRSPARGPRPPVA